MKLWGLLLIGLMLFTTVGCAARTGKVSWYGGKYHGRTTASGEVFNKEAMTAAHKDWRFGTRVRVTNPETGRSVVVRVNDRFPATKGRTLDLSEGAFRRIAPLARGVIDAEIEKLD